VGVVEVSEEQARVGEPAQRPPLLLHLLELRLGTKGADRAHEALLESLPGCAHDAPAFRPGVARSRRAEVGRLCALVECRGGGWRGCYAAAPPGAVAVEIRTTFSRRHLGR